jgi:hypothetical protein
MRLDVVHGHRLGEATNLDDEVLSSRYADLAWDAIGGCQARRQGRRGDVHVKPKVAPPVAACSLTCRPCRGHMNEAGERKTLTAAQRRRGTALARTVESHRPILLLKCQNPPAGPLLAPEVPKEGAHDNSRRPTALGVIA